MRNVVVDLVDVTKTYPGGTRVRALDGVTLAFAAGTFTAVMGPSGSGKSTLLHCAAGLSNSAICATLVLAPVSVEKHITNILAKLDLPPSDDAHRRVRAVLTYLNG
jgi:ABC-type lipoprotein export system ATPase subunit